MNLPRPNIPREYRGAVITLSLWGVPLLGADIGYIFSHGFDVASIGFAALALLPAWAFLERSIDLKFPGGSIKIGALEVKKTLKAADAAAPKAVSHFDSEFPLVKNGLAQLSDSVKNEHSDTVTAFIAEPTLDDLLYPKSIISKTDKRAALGDIMAGVAIDPNIALVNLRIEIERRTDQLMTSTKTATGRPSPLSAKIRMLKQIGIFEPGFADALLRLVDYGNRAAHGAKVELSVASEIIDGQDTILKTLDDLIGRAVVLG